MMDTTTKGTLLDRLLAQGAPPERDFGYIDRVIDRAIAKSVTMTDLREDDAPPKPKRRRMRRPDFVAMAKRAQAAGLNVSAVNVTANSVVLTLNDDELATDASVIETADELRKLI